MFTSSIFQHNFVMRYKVQMHKKHAFTSIAPEDNPDELSSKYLNTWKWCIRCGLLKLGKEYFIPGANQKLILQSSDKSPKCK